MSNAAFRRFLAVEVKRLVDDRDWSGLLRCWLTHGHPDALLQAVDLVAEMKNGLNCPAFQSYLEKFLLKVRYRADEASEEMISTFAEPLDWLNIIDDHWDRYTIRLVELFCLGNALAARSAKLPSELQRSLLTDATRAFEEAQKAAHPLADDGLQARCLVSVGSACAEVGERERAASLFAEAEKLYQERAMLSRASGQDDEAELYESYQLQAKEEIKKSKEGVRPKDDFSNVSVVVTTSRWELDGFRNAKVQVFDEFGPPDDRGPEKQAPERGIFNFLAVWCKRLFRRKELTRVARPPSDFQVAVGALEAGIRTADWLHRQAAPEEGDGPTGPSR